MLPIRQPTRESCFGMACRMGARARFGDIPDFYFGATTAGSAFWGKLTEIQGLQTAYFAAAAGLLLGVPLTWRWKLQTGAALDLAPALHWRAPTAVRRVQNNQGPVLIVVDYRVEAKNDPAP